MTDRASRPACGRAQPVICNGTHVCLELDVSGHVPAMVVAPILHAMSVLGTAMAICRRHRQSISSALRSWERYCKTLVPFLTVVDEELGTGYPVAYEGLAPM